MLQITPRTKIYLAVQPVDFRKGIEGLAAVCQHYLGEDPFSGNLFVFRNKRGTSIKLLIYDGQGYWVAQKRFSQGKLNWWTKSPQSTFQLSVSQLQILLWNGNPMTAQIAPDWRKIS